MKPTTKDIIYKGNSTISIEALPAYSKPVVVKRPSERPASRHYLSSLEREYELTRALDGVAGVRQALAQESVDDQPALILEYIEGETLRDVVERNPLDLRSRLQIAVELAGILQRIHERRVIHLGISSQNILVADKQRAVHVIDLGAAFRIEGSGEIRVGPDQILATLPYISPEQTGRINRAVDERSDLYSLGVVLYELLTGRLPFDTRDPMQLIHHHIARDPASPSAVSPEIPEVLSAIILKLLTKDAEDRYQSAAGVQADLEECSQRLSPEDIIEAFPLGEADYARRLRYPQELYGRDRELKELERAFESVCRGTTSIVFVGGYSGIGKTALVEEIRRPVSEKSGYFIGGKFDQLVTTPYAGISQALAQFVSQILTQSETGLAAWRSKILEAVGPNGRVLTDVIPSLKLVIGPQPAVPDLSGQEAQNRFNYVFQRFFGAISRSEHPICFLLDDLQWVDPGSLGLLKALFTSPDLAHLLVVGAYRDNEVHADHPLMTLIADLVKAGANLKRMTLPKLAEADVNALISDALRCDPGESRELSRLIHSQTNGNPFFTHQVLRSLEHQGLLSLDTAAGHWRWDMDALRDLDVTASVVELLVGKLKELPAETQETLKVAAGIGSQFDIATLTVVTAGDDDAATLDHLHAAVAAGLVWIRDDRGYFVHDRVQEAAYALAPIEERDRLHLTIGRSLLQRHRTSDDEQDIYRIVDQLNHGLHLVEDEQERMQLSRLNLQAARAARQASAFETGLNYAQAGIELLGENSWDQDYQLALALHEQAALLAHAAGNIPVTEQHSEQVLQRGRDPLDLARVQRLHIELLLASKRFDEAIDYGLGALRNFGQELPHNPDMEFTIAKLSEFLERLEREPPDYFSMPRLYDQDPELFAVSEILWPVGNAAFISRPALAPLMYMHILELSLGRRLLPEHAPGMISAVGMFANAFLGKVEVAHAYGETAVELASRAAFRTSIHVPLQVHGLYSHFWRESLRETLDLFDRGIQSAHDCGDNEFVAYMSHSWSKHAFYVSIELARVEERCLSLRTFVDGIQYLTQSRWINTYVTAVQALRGNSSAQGTTWRGTPFDDDRDLPDLQRVEDQLGLLYVYCAKAWVATLFGDHDGVEEYADLSYPFLVAAPVGLEKAILTFISGLRRARELRVTPENSESEQALREHLGSLERFAGLAPMNFAHKLLLVQAEVHRARGEVLQAMQTYEQASQGARENGYLSEAGLAHALAAEFFQDLGLHQAALHNAEQAAQAWRSWGAHALVESLNQRLPDLLEPSDSSRGISSEADSVRSTITRSTTPIQLDLETVTSATQLLSAETDSEQLCIQMMNLVMSNSGAETVVLLLKQGDEWFVQARSDIANSEHQVLMNQPFDPADGEHNLVPESVFHYCLRTEEVLVVSDARLDERFTTDRMIQQHQVKSMAGIAASRQAEVRAMLYLENRQVAGAFTQEHAAILRHLATQFAVSLENALLYEDLSRNFMQLRQSDERYELAVAGSDAGLFDWDIVSNELYCSDRLNELLGYQPDEISITLDWFFEQLHPEDSQVVRRALDKHLEDRTPYVIDYRLQTKSGEYRWYHARGQAVWDEAEKPIRMSGSITDITPRKQTEEALKQSKEFSQSILMSLPSHIAVLDREGNILSVNEAWRQFAADNDSNSPEAVGPGVNYIEVCQRAAVSGDQTVSEALDGIRSVLAGSSEYFELEYPCHSPLEKRWFTMTVSPFRGTKGGVIVTHIDIRARKLAERELGISEERFRRLMEESPLGISIWAPDGKIIEVNRAWMRTWDLNESEVARLIAEHNWLTDPQTEELGIMPLVEKAFAGDSVVLPPVEYSGERRMKELGLEDIKPRTIWLQVYLYSIKDEQGAVANVVAINMDITALKHAEREAREQRDALARVDRATRLGQLTGSIAHELNQPLTGILSNAQAAELMLENDRWQRDELAKVMSEIAVDTKRAGAVIRGLRELYREHKGDFSPVDVNSVVADTTRLLHSEMVLQQVEFTTEYATSLPNVNGNSVQIQQVLVNLIMNGVQAMSSVPKGRRLVRVATASEENEVVVWVEDCGPGIDPDKIDRIFEPLATWKPGGTGMGLTLSNSIIEAHGGRMWAENRTDGGARVGFALPVPR